jgi:hypothetical protein
VPAIASPPSAAAESAPDSIGISAGNFADPAFPPPSYAVWCESKHPWVSFPTGCKQYPQQSS